MQDHSLDTVRILRIVAWTWLGYLLLLLILDLILAPSFALRRYYAWHTAVALIFLTCAHWTWLQRRLDRYYAPLMLLLISGLPILLGRAVGRGWMPQPPPPGLPMPGPMMNIEGMTLRLMPVLLIALVIAAWQYSWRVVALLAVGTAVLEIALLPFFPPPNTPNSSHAVVFIAIVRAISFLVVGYFASRLIGRLRRQQRELAQANLQLRHYSSALEELTVSRERNRLARELHDTLAHTLSALSVQLETAKAYWDVQPETAWDLLCQSLATTRSGLNETRRSLKALRATPLQDLGLMLALQNLAQSAAARHNLALTLSLPAQSPALSPDVEQAVYRIAQEAIANVGRHAAADRLTVQLAVRGTAVSLTIGDDGLGMDQKQAVAANHFGVIGMRERAQLVGGRLQIDSRPGQGTRVRFTIEGDAHD